MTATQKTVAFWQGWPRDGTLFPAEYLKTNGWKYDLDGPDAGYSAGSGRTQIQNWDYNFGPDIEAAANAGVKAQLRLRTIASSDGFKPSISGVPAKTIPWFESNFGTLIDHIINTWGPGGAQGAVIDGFWWEGGLDNFVTWIREKTTLPLRQGIYAGMWEYSGYWDDVTVRLDVLDGVDLEAWCIHDAQYATATVAPYLLANYPAMSLGANSMPFNSPTAIGAESEYIWTQWRDDNPLGPGVNDPLPSVAESKRRFAQYLWLLKQATNSTLDTLDLEITMYLDTPETTPATTDTSPTFFEWVSSQMEWADKQQLTSAIPTVLLSNYATTLQS